MMSGIRLSKSSRLPEIFRSGAFLSSQHSTLKSKCSVVDASDTNDDDVDDEEDVDVGGGWVRRNDGWPSRVFDRIGVDKPLSSNLVADNFLSGVKDRDRCRCCDANDADVECDDPSGDRYCCFVDVVECRRKSQFSSFVRLIFLPKKDFVVTSKLSQALVWST